MPRSRNVKPKITKNYKLSKLPFEIRLLFTWLPMFADHKGLLADIPEEIHAEMFPFDHDLKIDNMLQMLHEQRFIDRYKTGALPGQDPTQTGFIRISNFLVHQNPHKKERDMPSKFPDYNPELRIPDQDPVNTGASPADSLNLIPDSLNLIPSTQTSGVDDPNFQTPKYTPEDVMEVCTLATTRYKSTQYPSQVQGQVHNLLPQIDKATLIKAINNVCDNFEQSNRPQDKRPNFDKQFSTAQAVKEMAERAVQAPQTSETGTSSVTEEDRQKWREIRERKNKERDQENR